MLSHFLCIVVLALPGVLAGTNPEGVKFLEENKKRPGVITLPSGLQYKVLKEGNGTTSPLFKTRTWVEYIGTTIFLTPNVTHDPPVDARYWTAFDEDEGDANFKPAQVIKGWGEAMQMMVEGDKWQLYVPSELGYGDKGSRPYIKGGEVLIFNLEIIEIRGESKDAGRCDVKTLKGCNDKKKAYIEKQQKGTAEQRNTELARLETMTKSGTLKDDAKEWLGIRIEILKKMTAKEEL